MNEAITTETEGATKKEELTPTATAAGAGATSAMARPLYTWKRKCGKFQVDISAEPVAFSNCHCHCCVAVMKYVEEKHPGGTSADVDGGVGKALFNLSSIKFVKVDGVDGEPSLDGDSDPLSDKVGYVKVGEKGKIVRTYTKCCGTLFHSAGGDNFPCNFR